MPLKAVFFDIDGTLVNSNEFHVMAWEEAFRDHGLLAGKATIRDQIGKGADQLIPSLFPGLGQDRQKTITERHGKIFRSRYLKQVKPFPRATDLAEMVHAKGMQIILASSADKTEVEHYMEALKVGPMLTGTPSSSTMQMAVSAKETSKPA